MPALRPTHWRVQDAIFTADGFVFDRQRGDHRIYVKDGFRSVVIPTWPDVPLVVIVRNMHTAGMSRDRYFELLASV